jgi:hypothetical protein
MPPVSSQLCAQSSQIRAHTAHTSAEQAELRSRKSAATRQISAQSSISRLAAFCLHRL